MNERGLTDVPENAVRDEPIAFGLTGIQLGICAGAVAVAALLNLLPVWEPIRLVFVILVAGPIGLAAALPVRGEPAYRWLVRLIRHLRSHRIWAATLEEPAKEPGLGIPSDNWEISGRGNTSPFQVQEPAMTPPDVPVAATEPEAQPRPPGRFALPRLRVLGGGHEAPTPAPDAGLDSDDEPRPALPHLVGGIRLVCLLAFAGGVGRTTLAVETASLVGSRARYRTLESEERPVRVLLLDAARSNPSAALRLGVDGATISRLASRYDWPDATTFEGRVIETRHGTDLLVLPSVPMNGLGPDLPFGPIEADAILDAAEHAGYQVVVADLGSAAEEGHRHLLTQAAVIAGVVTPRVASLPDVFRITTYVRAIGAGRKLILVENAAGTPSSVATLADEEQVPLVASVPRLPPFDLAGDRGIPAWIDDAGVEAAVRPLATAAWPLLGGVPTSSERRFRGLGSTVRRLLRVEGRQ